MIVRHLALILGLGLAWTLLRGWPPGLPAVARVALVLPVLACALTLWGGTRGKRPILPQPTTRPSWIDLTAIGALLLAIECTFLCLMLAAPGPLESAALVIERHIRPEAAALRTVSQESGQTAGNWLWDQETRRPLPRRTNFKPGKRPEIFVRLADPADAARLLSGKVYVAAFALGRYEQSVWSPLGSRPLTLAADSSEFVRVAPEKPGVSILHEVFHAKDPRERSPLTALQGLTEAAISPLERLDDGLHLLPPPESQRGYQYFARSTSMHIEQLPDDALLRTWPGADAALLALPPEPVFHNLVSIARKAAGEGSLKQQLLALQNHLRTAYQYSLATPNERDLDPIENFLFGEKRGHCEYFATAGALMARALGIPSRVAYGWAGGTWYESAGLFVFRAHEAHAWTEVWLENHGWVVMDPTPPAQGNERTQIAAAGEAPPVADPRSNPQDAPSSRSTAQPTVTMLPGVLTALALALAAGSFWLRGRRSARHADGLPNALPDNRPPPGYLAAWIRAMTTHGLHAEPGFTLRRQLALIEPSPPFARDLLRYHYGRHYEHRPRDPDFEKQLTRQIRAWEASISGISLHAPASHPRP